MKRILILLLILSSLSLASAARTGSLYPYCPEGVSGSYTQKFEINPNTLPSFEGELYFTGDVLMGSYCPEGQISYVPAYPKSIDYDISYYVGDDATFGISDARQNKPSDTIHSCTVSLKQACIQYQNPLGVEPVYILRCSDNEVKVDPVLAKAADYIRAGIKVKFNCAGEHSVGYESSFEFANPLMPISLNYDPVKVNPNLAAAPEERCNDEICNPEIGENCETCFFDCVCVDRATCDPDNSHADSIGCVPFVLEDCDNGLDDDFDGLIDCYDSQCFLARNCKEICDDGIDNDDDGDIDCDDILCTDDKACYYKVTGTLKTGKGQPIKNAKVSLLDSFSGGVYFETHSDENGEFEIDYSSKAKSWGMPTANLPAKLGVELTDKMGQVQVLWDFKSKGEPYSIKTTEFGLPTKDHFDLTMKSSNTIWAEKSKINPPKYYDTHWDAGQIYYDALRLFDFVRNNLKYPYAYGGNALPAKIYIYSKEDGPDSAFYSPTIRGGGIFFGYRASRHQDTQCPENCIWHELFHYTMYNKYGSFPSRNEPAANHGGFKNNNTGDSFIEGYAEFWPLILSKELDGATDAVYGGFANLEINYNPWEAEGLTEELAVASLFWDLVDSNQDTGDNTAFSYNELWDVFMAKKYNNMKEVYDAIQLKWPSKAADTNKVFVAHGLFKDTGKGNGKYDLREPYWDEDPDGDKGPLKANKKWDVGESYVDIGTPPNSSDIHQVFTEGQDRIGTASNYERTTRNSPRPFIPDSFVKVDGAPEDALFKVSYTFTDSSLNYESYGIVDNETGYVFIEQVPEEYGMTATVTIDNYEGSGSISVTSADYFIPNTAGQGFMKEDTISVGAKKTNYCNNDKTCQDDESSSCGDCSVTTVPSGGAIGTTPGTTTPGTSGNTPNTGTNTPLNIDPLLIAGAVGGLIFLVILILIIKRVRRPKQPPAQPQQQVYYQQQPQQGNVTVIQQ